MLLILLLLLHAPVLVVRATRIAMLNGNYFPTKTASPPQAWMNATFNLFNADFKAASVAGAALAITPEFALTSHEWLKSCQTPASATPWCPSLPPRLSCTTPNPNTAYQRLACLAKEHNITIAVNLCEGINGTNYNTQAIFDFTGQLIQKYHKMHPYYPHCFQQPSTLQLRTFNVSTVPFEIGIFTCKDILYSTPSKNLYAQGIRHFIYSSAIPLVGNVVKKLWSKKYKDSYLMASDSAKGDSGVYNNGDKIVTSTLNNGKIVLWDV